MSSIGTDGLIDLNQLRTEIQSQGGSVIGTTFPVTVSKGNVTYQVDQFGSTRIINFEENWTSADVGNSGNDWYEYKDNAGNIAEVNSPKLADGMTAIKYETATGDLVTGSKWANAMTKDGSMWVWIPRYAYKITEGSHQGGSTYVDDNGNPRGGTIEIKFLEGKSTITAEEAVAGWKLHPAFTFGTGTDKEITGFWFAKFEASPVGATSTSAAETSDTNKILQIKPNQFSWRNISSANIFSYCLNLKNMQSNNELVYFNNVSNVDTHMTKNVEWGAVAYLAHSKYGLNGEEICINTNSSYKTGYGIGDTTSTSGTGSTYNTTTGIKSSTTKNVYGIYDMSGGANEYVAACLSGYTSKLTEDGTIDTSKYIDVYSAYNNSKYGDAVYETSSNSSGSNSWFSDYSYFVCTSDPVFVRVGVYGDGSYAGLFSFHNYSGIAGNAGGFRPVCVVK